VFSCHGGKMSKGVVLFNTLYHATRQKICNYLFGELLIECAMP
jgi:hypothetical protein